MFTYAVKLKEKYKTIFAIYETITQATESSGLS